MKMLFTSESVTEGHPDKVCDQISDAVLDAILEKDPTARVACECCATTGLVLVMGEISTNSYISIADIARQKIREIGYDNADCGFDGNACAVMVSVDEQSPDIAQGVNNALEGRGENRFDIGAGDQGMMFGYACDETPEYMPMAIALAHRVTRKLAEVRKSRLVGYLRPDGKAQVTVEYVDGAPVRVDTVVLSTQHNPEAGHDEIERDMIEKVIRRVIPAEKGAMISIEKDQFLHALRRMSVISSDRYNGVIMTLGTDKVVLNSNNPDVGEANDEIDVVYVGEGRSVGYNVSYLTDAIDVVDEERIEFEVGEGMKPGIVRGLGNENYFCIVMPLKL